MNFRGRTLWTCALVCVAALAAGCGGSSGLGPLQISTTDLSAGDLGNPYSTVVNANGGTLPYTWTITSGLPPGLTFGTGTGSIAGIPTAAGTYNFTATVTDSSSPVETAHVALSLLIGNLQITYNSAVVGAVTTSLANGTLAVPYTQTVSSTGGTAPFTWSVSVGALPVWATLNASTGQITGTPTVGGVSNFTLEVADSESPSVSTTAKFTISTSPLTMQNTSLPNGLVGTPYSFTFTGAGGDPPYTWSLVTGTGQGTLPQGLTLNTTTGTISGTPTGAGTSVFSIHVVDSESPQETVTQTLQLTIQPSTSACASAPTGHESLLNGSYAFLVQGFEGGSAGSPVAIAGSFAANGGSQVSSGDVDVSDLTDTSSGDTHYTVAAYSAATPTSLYTVGLDPSGSGNVGCVMLTTSVGTTMAFRFSLGTLSGGVETKGEILEFDDTSGAGIVASGVLAQQTPSDFSGPKLSANYAFAVDGENLLGQPLAEVGSFSVSSNGGVSSAFADADIAGANSSALSGGSGSISGITTSDGRGTASITIGGVNLAWTVYIVNASEAYVVSTAFPAGGRMFATAKSFTQSSLPGPYVVYATGIKTCGGSPCADVNLGLLTLASGGAVTGPLWDYNVSAGESQAAASGTYAAASSFATSGRVTFTGVSSSESVAYQVSPVVDGISAVIVGTDAGAHLGFATLQSGTSLPVAGESVIYGTLDPRYNSAQAYVGTAVISAPGALSGTQDSSSQSGKLQAATVVSRTVSLIANGTGSVASGGGLNVAVTDGTRLFWFDYGGAPAVITVAEPQ